MESKPHSDLMLDGAELVAYYIEGKGRYVVPSPRVHVMAHYARNLEEQFEGVKRELEEARADLYQCKREREILSRNLSAFTGNA